MASKLKQHTTANQMLLDAIGSIVKEQVSQSEERMIARISTSEKQLEGKIKESERRLEAKFIAKIDESEQRQTKNLTDVILTVTQHMATTDQLDELKQRIDEIDQRTKVI